MPKVSIIIPAYNAEKYLRECLDSVVNQTLKDIELIIIDDGSTDSTGKIIEEYASKYPFVRHFHQSNKGLYRTREIGLERATGDYVGWIDADDYIKLDMFEKLYNAAVANDSELVITNYEFFPKKISTKEIWYQKYHGKIDTAFIERNSQPWNKIVKRELLNKLEVSKHFVECHDEIYIRVLLEAKNPVTIDEVLYMYRASGGMSSSYRNVDHYKKFVDASVSLLNIMKNVTEDKYWLDYFSNRVTYYLLMTMIVAAHVGDKSSYEEARIELQKIKPRFNKNQHYWNILRRNFGLIKAFVIGGLIPYNYFFTKAICKIAFR